MKAALKRGVDTGVLVQVKASYKLSPEAKKKAAAASKPKAAKKPAAKKVCFEQDVVRFSRGWVII